MAEEGEMKQTPNIERRTSNLEYSERGLPFGVRRFPVL
jgi:hypothetical protein